MLAKGGHITPLAADTLKERRVTLVREGQASEADAALAPKADIRSVAVASDHTGIALRQTLIAFLRGRGLAVDDLGTHTPDAVDYPDVAAEVADLVARGEADAGIVIDGAGIGPAIAAHQAKGNRAGTATTATTALDPRAHSGPGGLKRGAALARGG